jgi:hypothetical protein
LDCHDLFRGLFPFRVRVEADVSVTSPNGPPVAGLYAGEKRHPYPLVGTKPHSFASTNPTSEVMFTMNQMPPRGCRFDSVVFISTGGGYVQVGGAVAVGNIAACTHPVPTTTAPDPCDYYLLTILQVCGTNPSVAVATAEFKICATCP